MRTGARLLAVAGAVLLVLALRIVTGARAELMRGDRFRSAGDVDAAMIAYRRAAGWYLPGNPYATDALDRLIELAEACEDPDCALAAWRSVHGAILSTRSLYIPHRTRLRRADRRIAELTHASLEGTIEQDPPTVSELEAELTTIEEPHLGYSLVALAGWIFWTLGAFLFAHRAIDEEDRILAQPARLWGTVILTGMGMFVLGLSLA